jgi:hypothetical protein
MMINNFNVKTINSSNIKLTLHLHQYIYIYIYIYIIIIIIFRTCNKNIEGFNNLISPYIVYSQNIIKFFYQWSSFEQHHKIENNNNNNSLMLFLMF